MRRRHIWAGLLLIVTAPGLPVLAATSSDPFAINRAGAESRAALASLPVTFRIEPPREAIACSEWKVTTLVKGSPDPTWQLVGAFDTQDDLEVTIYGIPGRTTLVVVECPGRPGYSLHGPWVWGRRGLTEIIRFRRRRTVRVGFEMPSAQTVRMMMSQQYEGERWPECRLHRQGQAECIGLPFEATGVAIGEGRAGLRWGRAAPRAASVQMVSGVAARWGRLVYVTESAEQTGNDLRVTTWWQVPRPSGMSGLRVRLVPDSSTEVHQIGPRSFWIVGRGDTNDRFLEVKGEHTTTVRIEVDELIGAAADRALRVFLRPPVPVTGLTVDTGGAPVGGALVSLFELSRTKPLNGATRDDEVVTRRWVAETVSDSRGQFILNGPPPGEYEFLAVHPTRGRAVSEQRADGTPITLQLRSTPRVRGRVVRDRLPLGGIAVHSVPDKLVFARAPDPVMVLAPGTVTDEFGEFEMSLPGAGSGDVVIGGGGVATVRHRYADAESLPDVTDLGDITLPAPARLTVRLPLGGCQLMAAGPIGSLGMARVASAFDAGVSAYRFELPEPGFWWLEAICDGQPKTLLPPAVRVGGTSAGETVEVSFASPE